MGKNPAIKASHQSEAWSHFADGLGAVVFFFTPPTHTPTRQKIPTKYSRFFRLLKWPTLSADGKRLQWSRTAWQFFHSLRMTRRLRNHSADNSAMLADGNNGTSGASPSIWNSNLAGGSPFCPISAQQNDKRFSQNNIDDWLFILHLCVPFTPATLYFKISRKVIRAHCRQALLLFNIRPPAFPADSSAM
jgi:hypothetical protein